MNTPEQEERHTIFPFPPRFVPIDESLIETLSHNDLELVLTDTERKLEISDRVIKFIPREKETTEREIEEYEARDQGDPEVQETLSVKRQYLSEMNEVYPLVELDIKNEWDEIAKIKDEIKSRQSEADELRKAIQRLDSFTKYCERNVATFYDKLFLIRRQCRRQVLIQRLEELSDTTLPFNKKAVIKVGLTPDDEDIIEAFKGRYYVQSLRERTNQDPFKPEIDSNSTAAGSSSTSMEDIDRLMGSITIQDKHQRNARICEQNVQRTPSEQEKRRKEIHEKLAREKKAKEQAEAALVAFKNKVKRDKKLLSEIFTDYLAIQASHRALYKLAQNRLPEEVVMPWILKEVYHVWGTYRGGRTENSAVEIFLKERLTHWQNATSLPEEVKVRWVSIYETLTERMDDVIVQDYFVLKQMFHEFPDYRQYLESEMAFAIFTLPQLQTPIPDIGLHTEMPLTKLDDYIRRHAVRRYSRRIETGRLEMAEVEMIIAYKKSPWSSISTLAGRKILLQFRSKYLNDPRRPNDRRLQGLADAFDLLSKIPSPVLAFDAKFLNETANQEDFITYIKLMTDFLDA